MGLEVRNLNICRIGHANEPKLNTSWPTADDNLDELILFSVKGRSQIINIILPYEADARFPSHLDQGMQPIPDLKEESQAQKMDGRRGLDNTYNP